MSKKIITYTANLTVVGRCSLRELVVPEPLVEYATSSGGDSATFDLALDVGSVLVAACV